MVEALPDGKATVGFEVCVKHVAAAAETCRTHTSNPTVALPSGRFSNERIAELRSIIAIMPGVERTLVPIVPPTSVTRRSSTTKSSVRSIPGSRLKGASRPSPCRPRRRSSRR